VCLPGQPRYARTFQDHAESISTISTAVDMGGAAHARTSNTWKTDTELKHALGYHRGGGSDRSHALEWHGKGRGTTLVRVNDRGRRPKLVHVFKVCWVPSSQRRTQHASFMASWCSKCENPTSAPLIAPVVTITPLLLLYQVRTFYIIRYNCHTTHPSQPTYTFNSTPKRKRKINKGENKKQ